MSTGMTHRTNLPFLYTSRRIKMKMWTQTQKVAVTILCAVLIIAGVRLATTAYVQSIFRDTNMIGGYVGSYDGDPEMPKAMKVSWTKTSITDTTATIVLDQPIAGFVFACEVVNDATSTPQTTTYNIALQSPLGSDLTGTDWDSISTITTTYNKTTSDLPVLGYATLVLDTLGTPTAAGDIYIWYK